MISHDHKCIFIHIPKTGGSSVERIIWPEESDRTESNLFGGFIKPNFNKYQTGGLQHLLAKHVQNELDDRVFENYFKFAMVRNPWDKAVSQYEYSKRSKFLMKFLKLKKSDGFSEYLQKIQKIEHVQWECQHNFLFSDSGEQLVDYIGRFEKFEEEVKYFLSKIEFETIDRTVDIPHMKKSDRRHYADYYDEESIEIVRRIYLKDIEIFGYVFEEESGSIA